MMNVAGSFGELGRKVVKLAGSYDKLGRGL
jgi:hypothetical protein